MGISDLKVTVVIPTYKRESVLCDTIRQVLADPWPNKEVLVIDQTATHLAETRNYLESVKGSIRYIQRDRPSVTEAENFGIREAAGDIVIFLDDDVSFEPGLIAAHVRNYADASIAGVAGLVLEVGGKRVHRLPSICRNARLGFLFFRHDYSRRMFVPNVFEGNMSFRRRTLLDVGLIDERFGENAFLYGMDLAVRVARAGGKIVHDPDAAIVHLRHPSGGSRMTRARPLSFFRNLFYFLNKHANRHERFAMGLRFFFYRVLVDGWRQPWLVPANARRFVQAWWRERPKPGR